MISIILMKITTKWLAGKTIEPFRLGDPIKIKVESVNMLKKQMDFSLVDDGEFITQPREISP